MLYAPFRAGGDNFLQEVTQWQLFLVLLTTILARMDISQESVSDQSALGYLLIGFVVPGYLIMAWQFFQSESDGTESKVSPDDMESRSSFRPGLRKTDTAADRGRGEHGSGD